MAQEAKKESTQKSGLSFSFQKKIESKKLVSGDTGQENVRDKDDADLITSLEGKEIQSVKPKEKPKELVIPLIEKNHWRLSGTKKPENHSKHEDKKITEADSEAINEILHEAAVANESWEQRNTEDKNLVVPLLMQNKIPDGFETDDKLDVSLRPNEPEAVDYDQIPIESFGMAMLRGMGWKEGTGIGKNAKVVGTVEAVLRPKGMGLGADRRALQGLEDKKSKPSRPGDKPDEEELSYKKGACGVVEKGPHKDLYGKVEGIDEDNARIVVKLTISGQSITISQYSFRLVTKKDYDQFSKYINKSKTDRYKEEQVKKLNDKKSPSRYDDDRERNRSRDREHRYKDDKDREDRHKDSKYKDRDRKRPHEDDTYARDNSKKSSKHASSSHNSSSSNGNSKRESSLWIQPQIKVRLIDKHYKKGKYYNSKVEIVDVLSLDSCICRTEEGRLLEDISQNMLESVVPKSEQAHVVIVQGKYKGQLAQIVKKDKSKCRATVQLLRDRDEALKLDYDQICEYTGDIDDEFDY